MTTKGEAIDAVLGAAFVRGAADEHLTDVVHDARLDGATWQEVADAVGMTQDEAKARFTHADLTLYVAEPTAIGLAALAHKWGRDLTTACIRVLRDALDCASTGCGATAPARSRPTDAATERSSEDER